MHGSGFIAFLWQEKWVHFSTLLSFIKSVPGEKTTDFIMDGLCKSTHKSEKTELTWKLSISAFNFAQRQRDAEKRYGARSNLFNHPSSGRKVTAVWGNICQWNDPAPTPSPAPTPAMDTLQWPHPRGLGKRPVPGGLPQMALHTRLPRRTCVQGTGHPGAAGPSENPQEEDRQLGTL